jgi:putative transcriptional regulator
MREGLTQEGLAEALGVTRQTVIAIEKGNYAPSVHLALKIARHFKLPVEKIFHLPYGT